MRDWRRDGQTPVVREQTHTHVGLYLFVFLKVQPLHVVPEVHLTRSWYVPFTFDVCAEVEQRHASIFNTRLLGQRPSDPGSTPSPAAHDAQKPTPAGSRTEV